MKKLIVLFFLMVLLIPFAANASYVKVVVTRGADCKDYWQDFHFEPNTKYEIKSTSGIGTWSWGDKTEASLPKVVVSWWTGSSTFSTCQPTGGGMIYKSDWCDPVTGKKLKGPASGSRSVSLPPKQPYLLLVEERLWCYTLTQTPILGNAEEAWCQFGTAPEGINDFCLQSNYQDLFGCTLENYNVHYPSREQLIRYYCG